MELSIKMSPFPLAKEKTCDPSYTNQMLFSLEFEAHVECGEGGKAVGADPPHLSVTVHLFPFSP